MGELTYKAKRLGNEKSSNMQQAAGRPTNQWHTQNEGRAQGSSHGRRAFLGKVIGAAG